MSQFNFQSYESIVAKAQNNPDSSNAPKIGYFKLGPNEEALVRINIGSVDQISFATVHKPVFGKQYAGLPNPYAGISCFNELGSYSVDVCPLCRAVANNHPSIGKAEKKCFVPMLVSYKDAATGQWSAPVAVVWERPAGFARELATKLQTYGDLRNSLFKMTRVGSGKETKYTIDYALPTVFKPELIPADFSAFEGYQVNKHSYWELTKEQIEEYLTTGTFSVANNAANGQAPKVATAQSVAQVVAAFNQPTYTTPQSPYGMPYQPAQPTMPQAGPAFATQPTPVAQNVATQQPAGPYTQPAPVQQPAAEPVRNFNASKFSF